jgi:uncharacterized protein YjbJ (UPF0337 family)
MAIIIPILSQWNPKGLDKALSDIRRAEGGFNKFKAGIKGLALPATATFAAISAGAFASVKAAIAAEASQKRLAKILTTTGGATEEQITALNRQAAALEKVGVVSKENITITQSQLATFDLQGRTIAKLTPAILDYVTAEKGAAATGDDFKSMTNGLAQALNGQFGALTRVGFVLDEDTKKKIANGTESERAAAIVEVLNSTYKGFNETLLDTPEGSLIKLQQEFGRISEELGKALLPAVMIVTPMITQLFTFIADNSDVFLVLAGVVAAATGAIVALNIALLLNPITYVILGISALIALIALAALRFDYLKLTVFNIAAAIGQIFVYTANVVADVLTKMVNEFVKMYNSKILPAIRFFKKDAQALAEVDFTKPFDSANAAIDAFAAANRKTRSELDYNIDAMGAISDLVGDLTPDFGDLTDEMDKLAGSSDKVTEAMKRQKKAAEDAAKAIVDDLEKSLQSAERALDDVKSKFDDLQGTISGSVTEVIDFGGALESGNFMQGLVNQANAAKTFADKVKQLVQLGLSERGLRQVLDAGFESGTLIADQIILGGTTVVQQINELVASVAAVADEVGLQGAQNFYQAGVDSAQALVNGILSQLAAARAAYKALTDTTGTDTGPSVEVIKPKGDKGATPGPKPKLDISRLTASAVSKISTLSSSAARSYTALAQAYGITKFAQGGIVTQPMMGMVGEAGPEAIIPLNKAGGALGNTYNITVNAGMGTDGASVGRVIVDAIKKFEKTSGPVFASA